MISTGPRPSWRFSEASVRSAAAGESLAAIDHAQQRTVPVIQPCPGSGPARRGSRPSRPGAPTVRKRATSGAAAGTCPRCRRFEDRPGHRASSRTGSDERADAVDSRLATTGRPPHPRYDRAKWNRWLDEIAEPERLDVVDDHGVGRGQRDAVGPEAVVDPRLPLAISRPASAASNEVVCRRCCCREGRRSPLRRRGLMYGAIRRRKRPSSRARPGRSRPALRPRPGAFVGFERAAPSRGDRAVVFQDGDEPPSARAGPPGSGAGRSASGVTRTRGPVRCEHGSRVSPPRVSTTMTLHGRRSGRASSESSVGPSTCQPLTEAMTTDSSGSATSPAWRGGRGGHRGLLSLIRRFKCVHLE